MSKKKSDLGPRIATAVIAIPILFAIIFYGPPWAFFLLIAFGGTASAWEYCDINIKDGLPSARWIGTLATFAVMAGAFFFPKFLLEFSVSTITVVSLFFLFFYKEQEHAAKQLNATIMSIFYCGLMLVPLAIMREKAMDAGPYWVAMALAIIWGADTGAYAFGRMFGKRKLYEAVSPNKTIEGAVGAFVAGVLFTFAFNGLYQVLGVTAWKALEIWQVFALAIPATLLGMLGDLCESLIKRSTEVKDSGTIIYGHGGMFDRIDALIFSAPWFYFFVVNFTELPKPV